MKKLLLFSAMTASLFVADAQTFYNQNSCNTAYSLGTKDTCNPNVMTVGNQLWFTFIASASNETITITNIPGPGHVHQLALYSTCGSAPIDSVGLTTDTSTVPLVINASGLTIGSTYYLLFGREVPGCTACTGTVIFGYCIKGNISQPISEATIEAMDPNWWLLSQLPRERYDSIVKKTDAYFKFADSVRTANHYSINPADSAEGSELSVQNYSRWKSFWKTRLSGGSDSTAALFSARPKAAYNYFVAHSDPPSPYPADWNYIGPPSNIAGGIGNFPTNGMAAYVYFDPNDATFNTLYAGTATSGLWRTKDAQDPNPKWKSLLDNYLPAGLGVNAVAIDPNGVIFAGTGTNRYYSGYGDGYGVIYSTDGGTTWILSSLTVPTNVVTLQILIDTRTSPETIWVMTDNQVWYNAGGAATWSTAGSWTLQYTFPQPVSQWGGNSVLSQMILNPIIPNGSTSSVFVTGTGWSKYSDDWTLNGCVTTTDNLTGCTPNSPQNYPPPHFPPRGISCSGAVLYQVNAGGTPIVYVPYPCDPSSPFLCSNKQAVPSSISMSSIPSSNNIRVVFSTDTGNFQYDLLPNNSNSYNCNNCWTNPVVPINFPGGIFQVSPADANVEYCAASGGKSGLWLSTNGGMSYQNEMCGYGGSGAHPDVRSMAFQAATPGGTNDNIWIGDDGGVQQNDNNWNNPCSISWTNRNGISPTGIQLSEFYGIDVQENNQNVTVGGEQDNGCINNPTYNWVSQIGCDGGNTAIDNSGNWYATAVCGQYDDGVNENEGFCWDAQSNSQVPYIPVPIKVNKVNNNAYIGTYDIYDETGCNSTPPAKGLPGGSNGFVGAFATVPSTSIPSIDYNTMLAGRQGPAWNITPETAGGYLFVTKDINSATPTWTDITTRLNGVVNPFDPNHGIVNPFNWWPLTDIEAASDNPNIFYLSFGGFGGPRVVKVYYDFVLSAWLSTDMSNQLPNFPVNRLVFRNSSVEELYAATDAGVYRWNTNTQEWESFMTGLPPCIVSDIRINSCANKIRIATFGRGVWESDLPVITTTLPASPALQTWSSPVTEYGSINIPPGVTLNITSTVNMPFGAFINVEQGATLEVNGGTITNDCQDMWGGINVWGTNTQPQTISPTGQGEVILNNATIENAVNAVTTAELDASGNAIYATTGGIVKATNTQFINCQRAAQFLYYHNPNNIFINKSYFNGCHFVTNRFPLNDPNVNLFPCVTMYEVHGIYFINNTFINTTIAQGSNLGTGIYSIDASYNVGNGNSFEGMLYGIFATDAASSWNISVSGSTFTNNSGDVVLQGVPYSTVFNNNFIKNSGYSVPCPYCYLVFNLYLQGCTGYNVAGNSFTASGPIAIYTFGTEISGPGTSPSIIDNNIYNGVAYGDAGGDNNLLFQCNSYKNFPVNIPAGYDIGGNFGLIQGSYASPAANSFTQTSGIWDLYGSVPPGPFYYWYNPAYPLTVPVYYNSAWITYTTPNATTCPYVVNNGNPNFHSALKFYTNEEDSANNVLNLGNSSSLFNILNSPGSTPGQIQDTLLAVGPYLSDSVLIAAINKSLPPGILKNIIVPNSPLDSGIMGVLNTISLPPGIHRQIMAAQTGVSARAILQSDISYYGEEAGFALNGLVGYYLNDTLATAIDSIEALFQGMAAPASAQLAFLAGLQVSNGQYTQANQTIIAMQDIGDPYYANYLQLLPILMNLQQDSNHILALRNDTASTATVQKIAMDSTKFGFANARALLHFVFKENFAFPLYPTTRNGHHAQRITPSQNDSATTNLKGVKVYPNPANTQLTIEINFAKGGIANICLYNELGQRVYCQELKDIITTIPISSLTSGIYYYRILDIKGNLMREDKQMIIH